MDRLGTLDLLNSVLSKEKKRKMGETFRFVVGCLTAISIFSVVVGGIYFGVQESSSRYYKAQSECVQAGGSWIIFSSTTTEANCIRFGK